LKFTSPISRPSKHFRKILFKSGTFTVRQILWNKRKKGLPRNHFVDYVKHPPTFSSSTHLDRRPRSSTSDKFAIKF
jgi:hypothetical protein